MRVLGTLAVVAIVSSAATGAAAPPAARIAGLAVDVVSADVVRVTLRTPALPGGVPAGLAGQVLTLGEDVAVPLAAAADLAADGATARAAFDLKLRDVPERVLALDPERLRVRWEGLDAKGKTLAALEGTLDLGDPGETVLPLRKLYDTYARVDDLTVTPGLTAVSVHALLRLYDPFGFDIAVTRLEYAIKVGKQTVLASQHPGFRLRAGQRGDVLIEEQVALADAAGAVAAVLRGEAAALDGTLVIRTASGDREIPLHLGATP